jgi:Holliday junction resolvasome RuvABC endonuclease subunit
MKNIPTFEEFLNEDEEKPRVGHTVKRKKYKTDPPDIGLYSKGGKDAIKGTGYANKEKAEFTIKKLDYLMSKGERVWAMSIATTMESRAKKHQHQTPEMREAMKIFREWIDKNKIKESIEEGKSTGLFHPGDKDAVKGTGYGSKEKALATIKIIDELDKKDHRHAMAIATTMMNRAKHSDNQTEGMREAIPIFKEWIEKNRTT